jgi:hypothetical protein
VVEDGTDILYNYGLSAHPFDLRFALGMLAGRMEFMVGIIDTRFALDFYSRVENRTIIEQELGLSDRQKAFVLGRLGHDSLPENREYNYRYFTDNCATQVWDILAGEELGIARESPPPLRRPLRASVDAVLAGRPWIGLAIGILLGPKADAMPDPGAPVFLPGELMDWTGKALNPDAGKAAALVGESRVLYKARPEAAAGLDPVLAFLALAVISLALGILVRPAHALARAFDALVFGLAAVAGLAIALFWLGAGYGEVGMNLNLLWAGILPLIALVASRGHPGRRFPSILFRISCAAAGLAALFGGFGIQSVSPAIRLVATVIMLRTFFRAVPEGFPAFIRAHRARRGN